MPNDFHLKCSKDTVGLVELYKRIRNSLPSIFSVELGHLGATNFEEFGGGEILYVNGESTQRRVSARDAENRIFSLPVGSRHHYHVVKGRDKVGPLISLENILAKEKLPVHVQVTDPATQNKGLRVVRESHMRDEEIPNMVLIEEYECLYLTAHSIHSANGRPFEKVLYVPLYLDMLVKQCVGFEDKPDPELHWLAYLEYLEDFTKNIEYDRTVGFEEVLGTTLSDIEEMKELSDGTYDYVEDPMASLKIKCVSKETRRKIETIKNEFATVHSKPESHGPDYGPPPPLPKRAKSVDSKAKKENIQKERKFSDSGVMDELNRKIGALSKGTIKEDGTEEDAAKKPTIPCGVQHGSLDRPSGSGTSVITTQKETTSKKAECFEDKGSSGNSDQPSRIEVEMGNSGRAPLSGGSGGSVKMSRKGSELRSYGRLEDKPSPTKDNSYSSFPNDDKSTTPVPKPDSPRIVIDGKHEDSTKSLVHIEKKSHKGKIADMTISEVCSTLGELRLNKYTDKFRKECVDGEIMTHLDEDILKDDFGFKGVEAVRLMAFIRKGHIPK